MPRPHRVMEGSLTTEQDAGAAHGLHGPNILFFSDYAARGLELSRRERAYEQRQGIDGTYFARGIRLSERERAHPWECGDYYLEGDDLPHGTRKRMMTSPEWVAAGGLPLKTFKNRGVVAKRFPQTSRRRDLWFAHHEAVMCLRDDVLAFAVLDDAARHRWSDNQTRIEAQRRKHGFYEKFSGDVMTSTADVIAQGKTFNAIEADCPWAYDAGPGVQGTSDTRYSALSQSDLAAIPMAKLSRPTSTLFLWAPQSFNETAFWLMREWGFRNSGSAIVWHKTPGKPGCGHYARMVHEMLLIGLREQAPTWNCDVPSVIEAPRGEHSEKPDVFQQIIERVVPGPRLELFGRRRRDGWTVVGDQLK